MIRVVGWGTAWIILLIGFAMYAADLRRDPWHVFYWVMFILTLLCGAMAYGRLAEAWRERHDP